MVLQDLQVKKTHYLSSWATDLSGRGDNPDIVPRLHALRFELWTMIWVCPSSVILFYSRGTCDFETDLSPGNIFSGTPLWRCHSLNKTQPKPLPLDAMKVAGSFLWDSATAPSAISFVAFVLARWFPTCCPPCHESVTDVFVCNKNTTTSTVDGKWDTPSFGEAAVQNLVQGMYKGS